jgi:hypothetical protein
VKRLLNVLLVAGLLLLFIATVLLWARSHWWRRDSVDVWHSDGHSVFSGIHVLSSDGEILVQTFANHFKRWDSPYNNVRKKGPFDHCWYNVDSDLLPLGDFSEIGNHFGFAAKLSIQDDRWDVYTERNIYFPDWPLLVLLGALPALRAVQVISARRRRLAGRCAKCGYDLRATRDRCPECGAVTTNAPGQL